jgi:hypothetical protein
MSDAILRRFHRIKRNFAKPGIKLTWVEGASDEWVKRSVEDPHPATDDFNVAFDALAPFLDDAVGHTQAQQNALIMLGANFTYNKEGEAFVSLSGARTLEGYKALLAINLPSFVPSGLLQKALDDLEFEAGEYLDGKKGQLELPLEVDDEPDEQSDLDFERRDLDDTEA